MRKINHAYRIYAGKIRGWIYAVILYLVICFLLFISNLYIWNIPDYWSLFLYLFLAIIAISGGMLTGFSIKPLKPCFYPIEIRRLFRKYLLVLVLWMFLLSSCALIIAKLGYYGLDFSNIYSPGEIYLQTVDSKKFSGFFSYFWTFSCVVYYPVLVNSLVFWKCLNKTRKFYLGLSYIGALIVSVQNGSVIGLVVFFVPLLLAPYLRKLREQQNSSRQLKSNLAKRFLNFSNVFILLLVFGFQIYNIAGRGYTTNNYEKFPSNIGNIRINNSSLVVREMPQGIALPVIVALTYPTQGFQGLAYCLASPPFDPRPEGISHYISSKLDVDSALGCISYAGHKWDSRVNWSSYFSNAISSFGYVFSLIWIFSWFLVFGYCLKLWIAEGDVLSSTLISLYVTSVIMIPANDYIMQSPYVVNFVAYIVLGLMFRVHLFDEPLKNQ